MMALLLGILSLVDPITPSQLEAALQPPPRGEAAATLADRLRASFPAGTDLKTGRQKPLVEGSYVAFVVDCYSRAIVGWHAATVKDTAMVTTALTSLDHRRSGGMVGATSRSRICWGCSRNAGGYISGLVFSSGSVDRQM